MTRPGRQSAPDLAFVDGTWWGAGDREIDVVATDERGRVCRSCNWTNNPMDVREYAALQKDFALAGLDNSDPALALLLSRRLHPTRTLLAGTPTPAAVRSDALYR